MQSAFLLDALAFTFALIKKLNRQKLLCVNAYALAVTAHTLKLDLAVDQSKKCIVAAAADIDARMNLSATLTDKDVAGEDKLTVCALYAKALGLTITSVLC